MKYEKKSNNSHQDKSHQFRTKIVNKITDLDGPELLQFAMILVQGALKKSQVFDLYKSFLELSFLSKEGAWASKVDGQSALRQEKFV